MLCVEAQKMRACVRFMNEIEIELFVMIFQTENDRSKKKNKVMPTGQMRLDISN